jgi:endogenous inhibitor of DNA gyrase (YacG/DUF329 family)
MTLLQKERIVLLRGKGESYAKIAAMLELSVNTVKSYCRRNNLGVEYIAEEQSAATEGVCENCGCPLKRLPRAKQKRFCSDKCRMAWWKAHPEAVNRKAVYHFKCAACDTPFESYGNANRKYCSRACFGFSRRVSDE